MGWIEPVTLTGDRVALVPLHASHRDGLAAAASDGELWRLWYTDVPDPDGMAAAIAHRLALRDAGEMLPFAVIDPTTGTAVGMTSFGHLDPANRRLEIGWTWYARRTQRTGLNTEAKRLLLGHAFEQLGCIAVELRTHRLNRSSRAAIERLGAQLDGILRQHRRAKDGTLRDTCVYSIIDAEWPAVRSHLDALMAARTTASS